MLHLAAIFLLLLKHPGLARARAFSIFTLGTKICDVSHYPLFCLPTVPYPKTAPCTGPLLSAFSHSNDSRHLKRLLAVNPSTQPSNLYHTAEVHLNKYVLLPLQLHPLLFIIISAAYVGTLSSSQPN
jgi:hypothetical protein